jgi:hypothetical protein
MAGRNLGEAFVVISPDASTFLTELTAKISAAVKSFKAPPVTVPVNADTAPAIAQLSKLAGQAKTLYGTLASLRADVSTTAGQAALARLQAQVLMVAKQLNSLKVNVDATDLANAEAKLLGAAEAARKFNDALSGPVLGPATERLAALQAVAAKLSETLGSLQVRADDTSALARLVTLQAQADKLRETLADVTIGGDPARMSALTVQVLSLQAATEKLAASQDDAAGATTVWDKALAGLAARFGGGAQGIGWGAAIGGIQGWHIVLDAAIEATIIAIGVTAALGAAFAGAYPAIDQVAYHTKAAMDVMTAFNVDAGKLGGTLDKLQKSLAPQVIEAFGGALNLLSGQNTAVYQTAHQVVDMFDTWIAKLDLWAGGQRTLAGFMQAGVGYLQQLGKAAAIFGQSIDNLLTKDPGIAHYLLDLIQGFAQILNLFSRLPAPIVQATLMIHGFYLWISVLGGVLGKLLNPMVLLAGWFVKLGTAARDASSAQEVGGLAGWLGEMQAAGDKAATSVSGAAAAETALGDAAAKADVSQAAQELEGLATAGERAAAAVAGAAASETALGTAARGAAGAGAAAGAAGLAPEAVTAGAAAAGPAIAAEATAAGEGTAAAIVGAFTSAEGVKAAEAATMETFFDKLSVYATNTASKISSTFAVVFGRTTEELNAAVAAAASVASTPAEAALANLKKSIEDVGQTVIGMAQATGDGALMMGKYATGLSEAGQEAVALGVISHATEDDLARIAAQFAAEGAAAEASAGKTALTGAALTAVGDAAKKADVSQAAQEITQAGTAAEKSGGFFNTLAAHLFGVANSSKAVKEAGGAAALDAEAVAAGEAESAAGPMAATFAAAGTSIKAFGAGLLAFATNPVTLAVAGLALIAGGIVYTIYQMRQMSSAAKDWISSINTSLGSMSASDAIQSLITNISKLHDAIGTAFSRENIASIQSTFSGITNLGTFKANMIAAGDATARWTDTMKDVLNGNLGNAWHDLTSVVDTFSFRHDAAMHTAANDVKGYENELNKLVGSQAGMYQTLSKLMYGQNNLNLGTLTYTQSLQLMNLAQVRAGQSSALMMQEIANVVAGYNEMSAGGYQLQASINAVTLGTEMQDSKVAQLNQGWDAFFKLVSGGVSDFLTFAQQVNGMTETFANASGAGATLSISNGRVRDSITAAATAATGGKATMTGLNDASIAAQQTMLQTANAANAQMDSLQALAAAAGGGQHGMDMLQQATKDMLSTMLPAAQGSQQMTTVLYALAQRGGYPGADSFQALSHWIDTNSGTVKNAKPGLQDLQGIITQLTVGAGNLATDVKNLSVALGQNLTQAEASTVIAGSGASAAMSAFAASVFTSTANSKQQQDAALALGISLVKITGNVGDAKTQFLAFAQGALHMGSLEANTLWGEIAGKLAPTINSLATKDVPAAEKAFDNFAGAGGKSGLGMTTAQAGVLWGTLKSNLSTIMSDLTTKSAPAAQKAFEAWAGPGGKSGLGLTKVQADALWQYLKGNLAPMLQELSGSTVPTTQKAFEAWAGVGGKSGLGLTKAQADLLWQQTLPSLKKAIDDLPTDKQINIGMTGKGTYSIQQIMQAIAPQPARPGVSAPGAGGAAGLFISSGTGPTADDVPIWASKGELVVPTHLVASGAVDHLRGAIPGFAGGGVVGASPYSGNLTPASIQGMYADFQTTFQNAMVTAMKSSLTAATAAAAKALAGTPVGWSQVAGVTQWEGDVLSVLAMLGLPSTDLPTVMSQMITESGGNPNAINLSDINAQQGDPSRGLMQVIGSTFAAYRSPALSSNIYDPMANIYAGLNYAIHRYGNPGWLGVLGHGHGYAAGGLVGGLFPAWPAPSGSWQPGPWWGELLTKQAAETAAYAGDVSGLRAAEAKPGSWAHAHQAGIAGEMATLASRQAAETAAYKALGAPGAVPAAAAMSHLATMLRNEGVTIRDQDLATAQPALASALYRSLGQLAQTAGTTIAPVASADITPWPGGAGYEPPGTSLPPLPAAAPTPASGGTPGALGDKLVMTYQQLHALNRAHLTPFDRHQLHLWHELHLEHLAHLRALAGHAMGGLIGGAGVTQRAGMPSSVLPTKWFDAGGSLAPGYTLAYNGTGAAETVTPAGRGITAGEAAILAELRALRGATAQQGAIFGRVLNGTMTRGYYGR